MNPVYGFLIIGPGLIYMAVVIFRDWVDHKSAAAEPTEHTDAENVALLVEMNRATKDEAAETTALVGEPVQVWPTTLVPLGRLRVVRVKGWVG